MDIERMRSKIDEMDARIVKLLNQRAKMAIKIGEAKSRSDTPIFAPDREEKVLRKVARFTKEHGALSEEAVRAIYSEIISACRAAERQLVVTFLGPQGTFSHQAARTVAENASPAMHAARKRFGASVELRPVTRIDGVFAEVAQGRANFGVVPIENSTEGGIGATLDAFMETELKVCAEIMINVHHALLARCPANSVSKIYSKAEVLGQCKSWIANHYPKARQIAVASTAHAAEMVAGMKSAAAIAHEEAALLYGLNVLHRSIEDNPFNITRFFVIADASPAACGHDKTSILCFIKDQPGALYNILLPFRRAGINLTKIESWPSKRKAWDYCFFIDFEGHAASRNVAAMLEKVRSKCSVMKIIGSFPAAR